MKIVDVFDLVWLEKSFTAKITKKLKKHPLLSTFDLQKLGEGKEEAEIKEEVEERRAVKEEVFIPSEYRGIYKDSGIDLEEEIGGLREEWIRNI